MENHILIGVGGTGGKILKAFRKRMFQEYSEEERRKLPLGFIYVDSSMEMMNPKDQTWKVLGQDARLGNDSFLFVRSASLGDQLANIDNYPGINKWIGSKKIWNNIVGNVGDDGAAAQKRRLGRFLFSCSVNDYEAILKNQVKQVETKSGNSDITFHVFAGLAGGTGSGTIVDLVAQTRKHFQPNISSGLNYKIILYCQIPELSPLPNWDKGLYHANGYAALTELNALKVGKLHLHDVSGEFEYVPCDKNVFNAAFIYTNANENGKIVNTEKELPLMVADLAFHYITMGIDDNSRLFNDCFSTENIDPKDEFDENAEDKESAVALRSKVFKAFGIKRIINPESEICEYLTYTMARQALYQFKFNNWQEDKGYCDEPKNVDCRAMIYDEAFLERACLTDEHLMLSKGILDTEIAAKWKTISDDWGTFVPKLAQAAWQNNEAQALMELTRLCNQRYDSKFREMGVQRFFELKERSKNDIAAEIRKKIEKEFFDQWLSGKQAMSVITNEMSILLEYIDEKLNDLDEKKSKKAKKLADLQDRKKMIEAEWSHTGFISAAFGKKKNLYQEYTTNLQVLFTLRTELDALEFAKRLLAQVKVQMGELDATIKDINERFSQSVKIASEQIASRCNETTIATSSALKEAVVRYYDPAQVHLFADQLCLDRETQNGQNQTIRNRLAALCGEKTTFTNMVEEVSEDRILDILEDECINGVKAAHEKLMAGRQPVIGKNIIDSLYEKYGSSDKADALDEFARDIINSAGVYLTFDKSEIGRALNNNPVPNSKILMCNSVLITIPSSEKHKEFITRLKEAFRKNISGSKTIGFASTPIINGMPRNNEITIMSLTYSFPLRMVNDIKFLKTKYDLALPEGNDEINRLVLHLQGDGRGDQYPSLFVERFSAKNYLPQMLMGIAMGIIANQESGDGTGRKSYCQPRRNEFGMVMSTIIYGDKLTELHETETVKVADLRQLQAEIDKKLADEYLHINDRKVLTEKLVALNDLALAERRGNPNDETYKLYMETILKLVKELQK